MKLTAIPGKQNFGLFIYRGKKKDTYFVRREAKGKKPLFKKLRAQSLNFAREEANELVRIWLGLQPKIRENKLIEDLWAEWVTTKSDRSQGTIDSIFYTGKHITPFFGCLLPSEINGDLWEKYILKKRDERSERKFYNEWKWFSEFLSYLHDNGIISKKPLLRNPDPKTEAGTVLTHDQVLSLLSNSVGDLSLQILMSYTMGTRDNENKCLYWTSEVNGKKRSYIDLKNRSISLRPEDTKIRKGRAFPLSPEALTELSYRKEKSIGLAVFPSKENPDERAHRQSLKGSWTRCRENAGVECTFHDLRHTYLTNAFRNAKGLIDSLLICEAAGLSIEEAQKTYLHFELEDLRAVATLVGVSEYRRNGVEIHE